MLLVADVGYEALRNLTSRYQLELELTPTGEAIPHSFWGESEAGIAAGTVYVRGDTPVHSFLHEISHIICMSAARRSALQRDAGGDDLEEAAVCYLQVVLADYVRGVKQSQIMRDMDEWGYSFRLGSTMDWFQSDANDALHFLQEHKLLDADRLPLFRLRGQACRSV